jgi:hypothetical protein
MSTDDAKGNLEATVDAIFAEVKQKMPQRLAQERSVRAEFEERLYARWKRALDLFEMITLLTLEAEVSFSQKHSKHAVKEKDVIFEVLIQLHARACHTASEVRSLLASGHATAAFSRWRTLHELAVVASLIHDKGKDLAERYLFHEVIESVKAGEEYQRYCVRLGYKALEPDEIANRSALRANLIQRFGKPFSKPYGWAAQALGNNDPTFYDLECAVDLDYMRPHYRMASHGVHSNPKGVTFKIENIGSKQIMIAGPSRFGLADPGHASLLSLLQCTTVLLETKQDEETVITLQVLKRLVDEAGQAFLEIHKCLMNEDKAKN